MPTGDAQQAPGDVPPSSVPPGWETHIYPGVQTARVSLATRAALASALGEAGVEAEYFLALLEVFPGTERPAPEVAERLYDALEAWAARMPMVVSSLEVATQGYQGELNALYADLRDDPARMESVWWGEFAGYAFAGEPLALRLRRCGQSYRAVAESRLPALVEGIGEQMALLLHALVSLPPAGVAPLRSLYGGLSEITLELQGDLVPRRIRDLSADYPGLVTTISRLRAELATPSPIESDIAWAREQLDELQGGRPERPRGFGRRLFGAFSRKGSAASSGDTARREWEGIIAALIQLHGSYPH